MSLYVSSLPVGRGESAALAELTGISCMPGDASDWVHASRAVDDINKALRSEGLGSHRLRAPPAGLEVPAIRFVLPSDHLVQGGVLVDALEEAKPVTVPSERQILQNSPLA